MDLSVDQRSSRALGTPVRFGLLAVALVGVAACDPERIHDIIEAAGKGSVGGGAGGGSGAGGASVEPTCGPVCDIFCQYGHVIDDKGCQTCGCNPAPTSDPCAGLACAPGTHCEASAVMCVKAPCPAQAACVPDAPKVTCGGIAGIACPGGGTCVDDPSDMCDPKAGGADCGGICTCVQKVACIKGATFDGSPKVCACVPPTVPPPPPVCGPVCQIFCQFGNVVDSNGCPTCGCNPPPTSDPCAAVRCAAGTHCTTVVPPCASAAKTCPSQAVCVEDAPVVSCGGIAGIACPGSGTCIDDPSDTCDPKAGGADCGGICTCVQNVACVKGATFDSSPKVCACTTATVPPPPPPSSCGPVCAIFCAHGHVKDSSGCPTCACNP